MKKILSFKHPLLALAIVALAAVQAQAVPANPEPATVTQPDGSTLTVVLHGDEFYNFNTTADGYTIVKNEAGYYVYALPQGGTLKASTQVAHDAAQRSAGETSFLSAVSKYAIDSQEAAQGKAQRVKRDSQPQKTPAVDFSKFRGLIILVNYNDRTFTRGDAQQFYTRMYNEENYSGYTNEDGSYNNYGSQFLGSVRDYFYKNSNGKFTPQFDVVGPVTVNYSCTAGRNYSNNVFRAAMNQLDGTVDFSKYDNDGDGYVDMVYFVVAGYGSNYGGNNSSYLWPYKSNFRYSNITHDGVKIGLYACSVELYGVDNKGYTIPDGIGTFCHEFSHVLGLPDLYDTDYSGNGGESQTPDAWSVMAGGSYNNYGRRPVGYGAWERYALGFINPKVITGSGTYTLGGLQDNNEALILKSKTNNEYFMLDNRQLTGWDVTAPGHGMLVAHIDSTNASVWNSNKINCNPSHNYYLVLRAGGNTGSANASDAFPGTSGVTMLTNSTTANLVDWAGNNSQLIISGIKEQGGVVSFNVTDVDSLKNDVEDFESMATTSKTNAANVLGNYAYWSFTKSNVTAPGSTKADGSHSVAMKLPSAITSSPTYYDAYEVSLKVFNPLSSACKFTLYTSTDGGANWTVAKTGAGATSQEVPGKTTEDIYWSVNTSKETGVKYRIVLSSGSKTQACYIDNFKIYYGDKGTNPSPLLTIDAMHFADSVYTINVGEQLPIQPVVTPAGADNQVMTWTSSNTSAATVADGVVKGLEVGTATITAATTDGSNLTATCKVNVIRRVTSLALNHTALRLPQGSSIKLQATVKPANATTGTLMWTSSDPAILKVDTAGLVTALATGNAYVKAATVDGSGLADSCWMTVTGGATNYLTAPAQALACQAGATVVLPVSMVNADTISSLSLRLTLPSGFTLATDTAGKAKVHGSARMVDGQRVSTKVIDASTCEITTVNDSTGVAFTGNTGEILYIEAVAGKQNGTYTATVADAVLSPTSNGVPTVSPSVKISVNVTGGTTASGDINADGQVNVTDVTALINRVLGTASYSDAVCDLNGDGVVNVSDVTALINIILSNN